MASKDAVVVSSNVGLSSLHCPEEDDAKDKNHVIFLS